MPPTPAKGPQTYFAAAVAGNYPADPTSNNAALIASTESISTITIDDTDKTFADSASTGKTSGLQLNYSGVLTALPRGLLRLGTTYNYGDYGTNFCGAANCANYPDSATSAGYGFGYALELAGQGGALLNLGGLPFTPLVATPTCPAFPKPQTFQFVTVPGALTAQPPKSFTWTPTFETAYGSVDITTTGPSVVFSNIQQFTATGTQLVNYSTFSPPLVAYTSISGACSPTYYGNTISVPGDLGITSTQGNETFQVGAIVGIGPTGLLVEGDGAGSSPTPGSNVAIPEVFQPFLGAGSGAVGLPKPAAALDAGALAGAQYLGFIYDSGDYDVSATNGWTSNLGSFGGFPSPLPAACTAVADATGTQTNPIFGGDFPNNDATMTGDAGVATFGNCDVSIYLNAQDPKNNGLFPKASVTVGPNFAGNTAGQTYPAVAIAGQLQGKYAIFLVSATGEGIYLLQSN